MPIYKVDIKAELDLPINIEEWIYSLERTTNNKWLKEAILDYWEKKKVSN
ncbi:MULTISPECIES: hypothetical protein [Bacillaceae]|nr:MULTISPECIES: hypothetical protein [Bacillaceae]